MLAGQTRSPRRARRSGVAAVEAALCLTVFFMFLFGIFEYSRYLMMLHVATNAARDGARYASVNVDKPTDFDTVPTTIGARTYESIVAYTTRRMPGANNQIQNLAISVYPCDPSGMFSDPPVIAPKPGYVAPTPPSYAAVTRTTHWNSAAFTERIAVQISGNYIPATPNLLGLNSSVPVNIIALMGSEG